jgi:uncharacterized protein (TIGR02271 family)
VEEHLAAERAGIGAGVGATVGGLAGLLIGIGAFAIPGVGPIVAAGPIATLLAGVGIGAAAGTLIGALTKLGIPEAHARYYAEGVRRGGTLVTVTTDDARSSIAADTLARSGAADVQRGNEAWRGQGARTERATEKARQTQSEHAPLVDEAGMRNAVDERQSRGAKTRQVRDERAIPVVEEHLEVGKREVEGRGVRVHRTVVETPVEEEVTLRKEHVRVERHPVDREIDTRDLDRFGEEDFEVTERYEQAVVGKSARVVEEVVVGKEVEQRTEVVSDTVRRTDVQIEEIPGSEARMAFDSMDPDFRSNWETTYRPTGGTYDDFQPAYRHGYDLGSRYPDRDWNDVESHARTGWEQRRPGTWEKMKDAIRFAWDRARSRTAPRGYEDRHV